jgi:hypothetical protein
MTLDIDAKILQHTRDEFVTMNQVVQSLTDLEDLFRKTKDSRGLFVVAYVETTTSLRQKIQRQRQGEGQFFNDPDWIEQILLAFANLYRQALFGSIQNLAIPAAWQIAFSKASDRKTLSIQHFMLGINAHVLHDLPIAVYQANIGLSEERPAKRQDYNKVNDILRNATNSIQKKISNYHRAKGLGVLDQLFFGLDEWIADFFFRSERESSWYRAEELTNPREGETVDEVRRKIDVAAQKIALQISAWRFPYILANYFNPEDEVLVKVITPTEEELKAMYEIEGPGSNKTDETWNWTEII